MRIPIPIFTQRRRNAHELPGRCPRCGADRGFFVETEEIRIWLLFLPMGGGHSQLVGRCQACGAPAPAEVLKAVPKTNALIRFGWLFFLVIPLLGLGTAYFVDMKMTEARYAAERKAEEDYRRQKEADEKERRQVEEQYRTALESLTAAKAACVKSIDQASDAISKDLDKEKVRAPKDAAALQHTPLLVIGEPDIPEGPYLLGSPCPVSIDTEFQYMGTDVHGLYMGKPLEQIRAKTKEMLAAAKALVPATRWALVTFHCTDWACTSTVAFFDGPSKSLLAVARATKPKVDEMVGDRSALAKTLGDQLAKWK